MREIKFRMWMDSNKRMLYSEDYQLSDFFKNYEELKEAEDGGIYGKVALMQFTGLKDKNGVEIYEGDILETTLKKGKFVKVVFMDGQFKVKFKQKTFFSDHVIKPAVNFDVLSKFKVNYKVIGNIYENPELIEESEND